MPQDRLAPKAYWEDWHSGSIKKNPAAAMKSLCRRLLFPVLEPILSFPEWFLWKILYPRFLPVNPKLKVMEIGSAPGQTLVRFYKQFGYQPYGIDYTAAGCAANREVFNQIKIPPDHVYEEDFMSEALQGKLKESFDVVVSHGVIEHFSQPAEAVQKHLDILKPGGLLIIRIPNLRGKINQLFCRLLNSENITIHNLSIMELARFKEIFPNSVQTLHCAYLGIFSFHLFNADSPTKQWCLNLASIFQPALNLLFLLLAWNGWMDNAASSPYLIYIGRKQSA